jgi:hypothetical protein
MDIKNTFAHQFMKSAQAASKSAFEVRFNSIQRGLLGQMNKKIEALNQSGVEREVEELQKHRDDLANKSNTLRDLQSDIRTNALRFLEIRDRADEILAAVDTDEDDNLTDEDVAAINAAVAELSENISKLKFTHQYTEFTDGNLANRMRVNAHELSGYTAETGTVDSEGAPATNDNRAILDSLALISAQAGDYADSSTILVGSLNQLITDTDTRAYDTEADLAQLTAGELASRVEQAEELKIRYGNLIRSISLTFEVQSSFADSLLQGGSFEPPKGSILNIFS